MRTLHHPGWQRMLMGSQQIVETSRGDAMNGRGLNRTIGRIGIICVLVLGGCVTGPRFVSNSDRDADFGRFRTFTFESPLGTDRSNGTRTLLSHHLIEEVRRQMELRGYTLGDQGADLTINFYVSTKEKLDVRHVPGVGWGGYYGYRRDRYGVWGGYDTEVTQYTEGTLNIDVIDTKIDQLVWEGAVIGRVRNLEDEGLQARVQGAVRDLFAHYPYRAGG